MDLQLVFDIPEICARLGVRHAIISPGSRNGALTIAFARHPEIECHSVPDERSAAFIGLGMSLQTGKPTVLICTSGSAGLNYLPAISEAFFNRVPLLILTADRPKKLVNIRDGQTIFQDGMYGRHVKQGFALSEDDGLERCHKIVAEAIQQCTRVVMGPVHVNIPFSDPFYPKPGKNYPITKELTIQLNDRNTEYDQWPKEINEFKKVLLVVGQRPFDAAFQDGIGQVINQLKIPVVADIIANLNDVEGIIDHHDFFLNNSEDKELHPDLIITMGLSVLSKKLKALLRKSGACHWHIDEHNDSADTFGLLNREVSMPPSLFLHQWLKETVTNDNQVAFFNKWHALNTSQKERLKAQSNEEFAEPNIYQNVLNRIPDEIHLHLANSMAVRYANLFRTKSNGLSVFCNRGTSGIDGSNSTAVGSAIVSGKSTVLITGDVAFLYDRNAFWHNHVPDNLSIIVFNNGGGGIFRLINGPSDHKELEPFFETYQQSNARHLAKEFGFEYQDCTNMTSYSEQIEVFFKDMNQRRILEVFTAKKDNELAFKQMMQDVR